ncbi:hypothetical protein SHAQ108633_09080 [Shewanella aquimarina]
MTLRKLGANREALGFNHLPALNLRFKGYTGNGILGSNSNSSFKTIKANK